MGVKKEKEDRGKKRQKDEARQGAQRLAGLPTLTCSCVASRAVPSRLLTVRGTNSRSSDYYCVFVMEGF